MFCPFLALPGEGFFRLKPLSQLCAPKRLLDRREFLSHAIVAGWGRFGRSVQGGWCLGLFRQTLDTQPGFLAPLLPQRNNAYLIVSPLFPAHALSAIATINRASGYFCISSAA